MKTWRRSGELIHTLWALVFTVSTKSQINRQTDKSNRSTRSKKKSLLLNHRNGNAKSLSMLVHCCKTYIWCTHVLCIEKLRELCYEHTKKRTQDLAEIETALIKFSKSKMSCVFDTKQNLWMKLCQIQLS